jgi:Helix-turn-helix domain
MRLFRKETPSSLLGRIGLSKARAGKGLAHSDVPGDDSLSPSSRVVSSPTVFAQAEEAPPVSGVRSETTRRSNALDGSAVSIGQVLKIAREGKRMKLAELSNLTRIPTTTLRSIERDHFDGLPGEVFVRGFLRSIAREVGLSPDAIVAQYQQSRRLDSVSATPFFATSAARANRESRRFGVGVVCVILVLLLALAVSIVLRPRGREMPQELSQRSSIPMLRAGLPRDCAASMLDAHVHAG